MPSENFGLLWTPNKKISKHDEHLKKYIYYAVDNDCFNNPDLDIPYFISKLEKLPKQNCLFVACPDIVGDFKATLKRSKDFSPIVRKLGFKSALVLQDGATPCNIPWQEYDAIFIGGTDEFKLNAVLQGEIISKAKSSNKWVHVGRVNSRSRLATFYQLGADSADGTHLKFEPTQAAHRIKGWLNFINTQEVLF